MVSIHHLPGYACKTTCRWPVTQVRNRGVATDNAQPNKYNLKFKIKMIFKIYKKIDFFKYKNNLNLQKNETLGNNLCDKRL